MSAMMARQGYWVQLEQSHMHLGMNKARIATGRFFHATIKEMQYMFNKPCTDVDDETNWAVELNGQTIVKVAI
jgi:hypothetical protein